MLTRGDFVLMPDLAALAAIYIKNNKRVELDSGARYLTAPVDLGDGVLLANGNYANPLVYGSWGKPKTANFTGVANESRQIDASANTVDIALPVLAIGDSFVYHNLITSTFKVQILNPIETIKGKEGDIAATVNMELEAGQSFQMVAKSTTVLSITGVLL